jgi:hypothetical protein
MVHSENAAARYNVRVSPFAFFIDQTGRVEAKGLVNRRADLDVVARRDQMRHVAVGSS